ncbi:restriction endonuclease subunit S [Vibrio parahaemolyticus]|nr:restriction endonuclease subunit S [Vibrio parahaemolyticus]
MNCNWIELPLGDLIELKRGYDLPKSKRCHGNIPIVSSAGISDFHADSKVQAPGVVTGRYGTIGEVFYVEENFWPLNTTLYVKDFKGNYPEFVYYLLKTFDFHKYSDKAAVPGVNRNHLHMEMVRVPSDYDCQKKIASYLSKLDKKISLNTDVNNTLEEIAQAIFKSWFVDFDPVKAKMNGEQPEGMDAATASLFPEKLVESELGLIPEGWSVEEAKSQLDVLRGFSYKGKGLVGSLDKGVPMHNLNSVLEGGGYKYAGLKFYSEEFKEKFAIKEGDVLVANTEQGHNHLLIGYGAMVPKHLAHGFFSHHTYRVRPKKNSNVTPEFIERLFGKGRFVRQVQGFTNGTTVNMLPVAGMEMPQFVVPSKALAQKFSELVKPMKAMIEENHKSNIELAKLRDTLLPKLLSGEIELDVEKVNAND